MIPFFVADRPMSLRILKGLNLKKYPGVKIGIMAHANTSDNFKRAFRDYPCEDLERCDAISGKPCLYKDKSDKERHECTHRKLIVKRTVKMCDSGVFTKEGAMLSYDELFAAYDSMKVDYGIMIDVLHDAKATINSALEAKKAYEPYKKKFKLIVVAQGKTEEEYLDCYDKLKFHGFKNIAIGGLLRRNQNTVRYVRVGSEELLFSILEKVRDKYSPDWLFALGCLNPRRVEKLKQLNVWADYKGWIFQYKKRNQSLNTLLADFEKNYCNKHHSLEQEKDIKDLKKYINKRKKLFVSQTETAKKLNRGKQEVRSELKKIFQVLSLGKYNTSKAFYKLVNRGFFSNKEKQIIIEAYNELKREEICNESYIMVKAEENLKLNVEKKDIENSINEINKKILSVLKKMAKDKNQHTAKELQKYREIINIIEKNEHNHRLEQVRRYIEKEILELMLCR